MVDLDALHTIRLFNAASTLRPLVTGKDDSGHIAAKGSKEATSQAGQTKLFPQIGKLVILHHDVTIETRRTIDRWITFERKGGKQYPCHKTGIAQVL